jgi:hypothetical protein
LKLKQFFDHAHRRMKDELKATLTNTSKWVNAWGIVTLSAGIAASVGWSVVKGSVSAARTGLDVIARACTVMSAATSAAAVLSPLPSSGIVLSTASVITNGIGTTASIILSLAANCVESKTKMSLN